MKNLKKHIIGFISIISIICFFFASGTAQNDKIKQNRQQLEKLNREIGKTREEIKQLEKKEKSTTGALNTYQKHISQVNRYLNALGNEISTLQDSIEFLGRIITFGSQNRQMLKYHLTRLAGKFAVKPEYSAEEMLITGNSGAGNLRDSIYLAWILSQSKEKLNQIELIIDSTELAVHDLYEKTVRVEELKEEKDKEQQELNRAITGKRRVLASIRKDRSSLEKQLRQKQQSAKKIEAIIAELIRKEMEKSSAEPAKPAGKYIWPVNSRRVIRGFGEYRNAQTGTVMDNPGIDIAAPMGTDVMAADAGEVSVVHWLPGYGSLVIINHGGGWRTVYANLSRVNVSAGQSVSKGGVIGQSGESVDGELLHFELWKGTEKQDPQRYLK